MNTNILHLIVNKSIQHITSKHHFTQSVWSQILPSTSHLHHPGGTAFIVRPPSSQHISKRHIDPMGRWAGVTLSLKGRAPITVMLTYQSVTTQNIKGTTNVTAQQLRWLQDCHIQETSRQKYCKDLGNFIAQLQQKEHHLII
jgi:hypothetical protein